MKIQFNQYVKVYFKDNRLPMFGKFVQLTDAKDLNTKGFIRFVSRANDDKFNETNHVMFTKIFQVNTFKSITAHETVCI